MTAPAVTICGTCPHCDGTLNLTTSGRASSHELTAILTCEHCLREYVLSIALILIAASASRSSAQVERLRKRELAPA